MGSLIVRGLDDELIARLKSRAEERGRSAEAEHRELLREALLGSPGFDNFAASLRAFLAGREHTPSEVLQREGRDERSANPTDGAIGYDQDFYAWANAQAGLLRAGRLSELDSEHLAEEIESVGASERREVRHRLAHLVQHLLKWQFQPERRSRSWSATILIQRTELQAILDDSPSLKGILPEVLPAAFVLGREWALAETGLLRLREDCPWPIEHILDRDFLPD